MKKQIKFPLNIQYFAETVPNGGVIDQQNQGLESQTQEQELDFAGIKVKAADENIKKVHDSYKNMQSTFTKTQQENATLKAELEKLRNGGTQTQQTQTQQGQQGQQQELYNSEYLIQRAVNQDFTQLLKGDLDTITKDPMRSEYYKIAKPTFDKVVENLPMEQKMAYLKGDKNIITAALKYAYAEESFKLNPNNLFNNQEVQKIAANNPNVQNTVLANNLNKYQEQETLPPNLNGGAAATSNAYELLNREPRNMKEAAERSRLRRELARNPINR